MALHGDILIHVGNALRRARQSRHLTLRDVGERSQGRFKPTAVAGYERAERSISLERFCELSELYDMAPERLLSQILWRMRDRPEATIDRAKVSGLPSEERGTLSGFIDQVRTMRNDARDDTITLRVRDLEVLATVSGQRLDTFLEHVRPALVSDSGST
jgi:transcriptional regulator with XRE-family HTH domain